MTHMMITRAEAEAAEQGGTGEGGTAGDPCPGV